MKLLEESSAEIRDRLIEEINQMRMYEELDEPIKGYLLATYGILEQVEKGRGRAEHYDISSKVLSGTVTEALQLLQRAGVVEINDRGFRNLEDGRRIKDATYCLTQKGTEFLVEFLGIARKLRPYNAQ